MVNSGYIKDALTNIGILIKRSKVGMLCVLFVLPWFIVQAIHQYARFVDVTFIIENLTAYAEDLASTIKPERMPA
jgi:hypothetical protein